MSRWTRNRKWMYISAICFMLILAAPDEQKPSDQAQLTQMKTGESESSGYVSTTAEGTPTNISADELQIEKNAISTDESRTEENEISVDDSQKIMAEVENEVEFDVEAEIEPEVKDVAAQVQIQSASADIDAAPSEEPAIPVLSTKVLSQYKAVEVTATGYSPNFESTGKHPNHPEYGITYSGVKVVRDPAAISTIAADLSIFPLGTVLYVPGYGYGLVCDIGSAIKGHKIDLFYETKEHVYAQWGKKQLEVYVVEWGEGQVNEQIFQQMAEKYKE